MRPLPTRSGNSESAGPVRVPLIAANWKMHMTATQARQFVIRLRPLLKDIRDREIVIFAPYTSLAVIAEELRDPNIAWGGQNLYWEQEGPYTGEIAGNFLTDLGCTFVLVGHSERRQLFGETDDHCRKKLQAALRTGLTPVLCCGETIAERKAGKTTATITRQLTAALEGLKETDDLVIAYEPVWAIGTGSNATPDQAREIHTFIRQWLTGRISDRFARSTRIIYGGSVKPDNIDALMAEPEIDGVLVGGASLDVNSLVRIIRYRPATVGH